MATQIVFLSNGPGSTATYVGNPADDNFIITDNGGNDTITLGDGADQLTLLGGNNTLTLGTGNDQIVAGGGNNTITTGSGNSHVTVGNGNDTITAGTGSNVIVLGNGLDTVSTGSGNNALSSNVVSVSAAAVSGDTIMGAVTSLNGTTNELLLTTAGTMSPVNVSGFQSYQLANGGANSLTLVTANFARLPGHSITVFGGNSGNTVNASALPAADAVIFYGGAGTNIFDGGAGNDTFNPGSGTNTFAGGGGTDTIVFTGMRSQYQVTNLNFSNDSVQIVDERSGSPNGTDAISQVTYFQFSDGTLSFNQLANQPPNPPPPAGTMADMILRDGANGNYEIYDIGSNAILAAYPLGQVGPEWQVAGLGGFYGTTAPTPVT